MGKMPPEGDRTPDDRKWQVINFLRSLSKKEAGEKAVPRQ